MSYDYIIVGGGVSGLNTSLKLANGKNKILLLERNNRLGGRLHTYNKKNINYEIGGARFHKGHKNLFELIKMFNLEKMLVPITNDITFMPIKNKFKKKYDTNKIIDKLLEKSSSISKIDLLKTNLSKLSDKLLDLEESNYFKSSFEYISELENLNAYESIETFKNDLNHKLQFYLFKNGFSELIELMGKFLQENNCDIKLQHTLINIKKEKETYILDILNSSNSNSNSYKTNSNSYKTNSNSYKTNNLILALDKTALLSIPYLKPIHSILNSVEGIPLLRIYAIYPADPKTKKVWFHDIGKVTTDLDIKYIIPYNIKTGLIMISYTDQKLALQWNNMGTDLQNNIAKQLKKLFPNKKIPKPTYIKPHFWNNGIHFWKDNKEGFVESKKILQPFKNESLYICGEAYSERQGWVEGALESSEEVIKLINSIKTNKKSQHQRKTKKKKKKKKSHHQRENTKSHHQRENKKSKKIKFYTKKEVAKHNKKDDLWIIINKQVLDVTKWQHSHPGSASPIQKMGGKDATNAFMWRGHSSYAKKLMKQFIIGKIK